MEDFKKLNKYLKWYEKELTKSPKFNQDKYEKILDKTRYIALNTCRDGIAYFKNDDIILPSVYISLNETIELVLKYLKKLNKKYQDNLLQTLDNKTFCFTEVKKIANMKNDINKEIFLEDLAGVINNQFFVNIVIHNTIKDAFSVVHEFSHINNMELKMDKSSYFLFTEGYATFFEIDFYLYLLNTKYKKEAIKYYESLLLSFLYKSATFISEDNILDIYDKYGKVNYQKIYKYYQNKEDFLEIFKEILISVNNLNQKIDNQFDNILNDIPYIIGIPFSFEIRKEYSKNKEMFFYEYENLNSLDIDYYLNKYISNKELENLFEMQRKLKKM